MKIAHFQGHFSTRYNWIWQTKLSPDYKYGKMREKKCAYQIFYFGNFVTVDFCQTY